MPKDRPLVSNPLAHILLGAIHRPENLGPMVRDGIRETAGAILEELGIRLQTPSQSTEPDGAAAASHPQKENNTT